MDKVKILQDKLKKQNVDATLISSLPNITYLTSFAGFSKGEREAYLLVTQNNKYIFTDGRFSEVIKKELIEFELLEISRKTAFKDQLKSVVLKNKIKKFAIEDSDLTVAEFTEVKKTLTKEVKFTSSNKLIENMRIKKSSNEILKIEKACKVADKAFSYILEKIKTGVTEKEIAIEIEFYIKQNSEDISFDPIVAFGANSSIPHHKPTINKLKKGDIVLLDFGAKVENYCSDMTRTLFFGKATDKQKKIYQTVFDAQQKAIDYLFKVRPCKDYISHARSDLVAIKASDVDKVARDYITSQGYPSIPHSLGHGIGIEVHEGVRLSPHSKTILKNGMVFSIEPGVYIPDFGGVRIEDLATLENDKLKILTKSDKNLIQL